jgi:hypothetical protein
VKLLAAHGIPAATADLLPLWVIYLTLNQPNPKVMPGLPLDMALMALAEAAGKKVAGLESIVEQMKSLSDLGPSDLLQLLVQTICNYDQIHEDMERLINLYVQRDLSGIFATLHRYEEDGSGSDGRLAESLLWGRNARMIERMVPYLQSGSAFIAIGAMHLPGERGLLALLRRAGFLVEAVY